MCNYWGQYTYTSRCALVRAPAEAGVTDHQTVEVCSHVGNIVVGSVGVQAYHDHHRPVSDRFV